MAGSFLLVITRTIIQALENKLCLVLALPLWSGLCHQVRRRLHRQISWKSLDVWCWSLRLEAILPPSTGSTGYGHEIVRHFKHILSGRSWQKVPFWQIFHTSVSPRISLRCGPLSYAAKLSSHTTFSLPIFLGLSGPYFNKTALLKVGKSYLWTLPTTSSQELKRLSMKSIEKSASQPQSPASWTISWFSAQGFPEKPSNSPPRQKSSHPKDQRDAYPRHWEDVSSQTLWPRAASAPKKRNLNPGE